METGTRTPAERVYRSWSQDGSIELFGGLAALCVGIAWISDIVVLGPLAPVLAVPLWSAFRRRVVEPRFGYVRFDEPRRKRLKRGYVILVLVASVLLVKGVALYVYLRGGGASGHELVRRFMPGVPGISLGLAIAFGAAVYGVPRFGLFGAVFVAAGLGVVALGVDPGWALFVGGLVAALSGCWLLARFLMRYPPLSNDLE